MSRRSAGAVRGLLVMKVGVGFCTGALVSLVAYGTRRPIEAVKQGIGELATVHERRVGPVTDHRPGMLRSKVASGCSP
jgi:hypothetical protein